MHTAARCMLLLAVVPSAAVWATEPGVSRSTRAVPAATAPVIDGVLDEACWSGDPAFQEFQSADDPDKLHPHQTRGWIGYDARHLYVAVDCGVPDVDALRQRLAESPDEVKEGIRLFVDARHARQLQLYEEFRLNANGTTGYVFSPGTGRGRKMRPIDELKIDALIPATFGLPLTTDYLESAVSFTDKGYRIEAAIPWAMLHLGRETAGTWGCAVHRSHDDRTNASTGAGSARSFWASGSDDPRQFGQLEIDADFSPYHWDLHFIPPQPGDEAVEVQLTNQTGQAFAGELQLIATRRSDEDPYHRPDGEVFQYVEPVRIENGAQAHISLPHPVDTGDLEARYQFRLADPNGAPVILGGTSRKDITPGDNWPSPEATEAEQRAGYLVYARPYTRPMTYRSVPQREEVIHEFQIVGCSGEYVPWTFSLYPLRDVAGVQVNVSDLAGPDGAVIPSAAVDMRRVEHQSLWQEKWIAYSFRSQENLLRHFDRLNLNKGRSQRFWLTAKLADRQPAGEYTGTVTVGSSEGETHLPVRLTVMPFKLASVADMGYFIYANGAMTESVARVRNVARDMREHGMNTTTVYYFAEIGHNTGDIRLEVDQPVGYSKETGWVVDPSKPMSYAELIDILVESGLTGSVPLIEMYAGGMGAGYKVELVGELDRIFEERHWPEVLYYVWDEFDASEETTRRARNRFSSLRKHGLGHLKTTTAITARAEMRERTDALAPLYDVWILGTPTADLLIKGRALGKQLWSYGWGLSYDYGTADLRHYFGRYLWKTGLHGASMWCYNHGQFRGRFFGYLDRREVAFAPSEHNMLFSYVWIEDEEIIPTVKWEAIREGVDDYRYLRTLDQFATAAMVADDDRLRAAGQAGLDLLDEIAGNTVLVVSSAQVADKASLARVDMHGERRRVADAILDILAATGK